MPLADGAEFAGYTIVRLLGVGGMGEVYLAQHPRLPRQDALKVLGAAVSADEEYRQRFNLEAETVSTLRHPHIVTIHDRGEFDGQLWIAMEFVDGTDAGLQLQTNPNGIGPDELVRIVTAVAGALDYAHSRHVLHRDIKPANILLGQRDGGDDRVLLADFGVARRIGQTSDLTGADMTVGTVTYAAPEQLRGESTDGRADQYALAATAYHMLTGTAPFTNSNPAVVIGQHLSAAPPAIDRPDLSSFGTVFAKALAKNPAQRYETCADFAEALRKASAATAMTPRHRRPEGSRRTARWIVAGLAGAAVAVTAFLALLNRSAPVAPPPPPAVSARMDLPVVVLGADCAVLGAAGVDAAGANAYCARAGSENDQRVWSVVPGRLRASS